MQTGVKEVELRVLWRRYKEEGDPSARQRRAFVLRIRLTPRDVARGIVVSSPGRWVCRRVLVADASPRQCEAIVAPAPTTWLPPFCADDVNSWDYC